MKAKQISVLDTLNIAKYKGKANYVDCFSIAVADNVTVEDCIRHFFSWPKWVVVLFKIRNIVVKPFGIRTRKEDIELLLHPVFDFRVNGNIGFARVLEITPDEVLSFGADWHLDTWFSMAVKETGEGRMLYTTTMVKYNNFIGRCYMTTIRPFHKLIVKTSMNSLF